MSMIKNAGWFIFALLGFAVLAILPGVFLMAFGQLFGSILDGAVRGK